MADQAKSWERLEEETAKSYRAFCIYRNLGPGRSLQKASIEIYGKTTVSLRYLEQWSSKFSWVYRAEAWDAHEEESKRLAREQAREKAREKFVNHAENLSQCLLDVALGVKDANRDQVKAILEALDRAGISVPKEMKIEHSGPDGGPITVNRTPEERRERLKELQAMLRITGERE
ncbi:MAG: hypothetical protein ACNA8W_07440 [Bradymonadaceae bacterium]